MSLKKDVIGAEVQIGTNQAQAGLTKLAQETSKLTGENDRLRISQAKLKALGKEHAEEYKKVTAAITDNNKTIKANQVQMDALRKTIGLSDMSMKQMRAQATTLRRELSSMNQTADPVRWKKLNDELKATEKQMGKVQSSIGQTKGAMGALEGILPVIGFAAIAAGAKALITNVIDVRKEFEKYEAVLTNTLGSQKEARKEMQMLQKFAAETPFALTELTGSFVKLTNYGLKPSREEMRKYGDLASSVGKGIDQFSEALADAVTGEFERLKEFGIKSKKEGDKITFTFKEQSTVVDNNAQAIKGYISGLGDLQGVAGSMAAIAGTLGGKISNMGDAWDGLMNTMGGGTSGIMVTVIGWLTSFVQNLDMAFKSISSIKEAVRDQSVIDGMNNAIVEIDQMTRTLILGGMDQAKAHAKAIDLYNKSIDDGLRSNQASTRGMTEEQKVQSGKRFQLMMQERKAVTAHYAHLEELKLVQQKIASQKLSAEEAKDAEKAAKDKIAAKTKSDKDLLDAANVVDKEDPINTDWILAQVTADNEKFAAKKRSEEEWTAFLNKEIEKQVAIQKRGLEIDKEIESAREELKDMRIDAIGQIAGALSGMFEEGSAAQIAFFAIEKAIAIAQIWMSYAKESAAIAVTAAELNAVSFGVAGTAWAAVMQPKALTRAGINTGIVAAQAIAQVMGSKQSGGFSNTGSDSDPDGIYHKNEFIGSGPSVRNPKVKKVYDIINMAQEQGTVATLDLPAVMASMGMLPTGKQTGGFASGSSSVSPITVNPSINRDPELTAAMNSMAAAAALLIQNGVQFPIVPFKKRYEEVSGLLDQTGMGGFKKKP